MRPSNIRRAVLEILERAQPFALPEGQLHTELNGAVRPRAGKAEFAEMLLFLRTREFITTVPDPLDDQMVKWAITEAGLTMLRH